LSDNRKKQQLNLARLRREIAGATSPPKGTIGSDKLFELIKYDNPSF
jgi:hypothetical protein